MMLAALSGVGRGSSSDQPIRAEIQHVLAIPDRADDPDVAAFKLEFDVRLTNRSGGLVSLPKSESGDAAATRIAVLGVQTKQRDGRWAHLVQSSWYDAGTLKYESCRTLPPGGVAEFANLPSGLMLLKSQLAGLGNEPTVRIDLLIFCRQPDGEVVTTRALSDGFELRLPKARP